jgi:aspartyl-tRNA(Asn)/glutamyl-tRNA(Gln) amidotransferase subunit A
LDGIEAFSIVAFSRALAARRMSARELIDATLERIAQRVQLNCFITVRAEPARAAAEAADVRRARGASLGPLDGVPIAVKDNIAVAGVPATAGMAARRGRVPGRDAFCVTKLQAQGAIIIGKTNLHEAALGATNDNPHYGRCFNPHGAERTPGGSSGGSAAAVAARLVPGTLGTDTMGSIRIPASYCGVVGLKPTFGRVSTSGVCPLSWRLDHVGPLGATVDDAGLLLEAISGFDPECPESRQPGESRPASGRLGVLRNYDAPAAAGPVREAFERALGVLERLGYRIETVEIAGYDPSQARRCGLLMVEADAFLVHEKDLTERPELFSDEARAMLDYGRRATAARLAKAERVVALAAAGARRLLEGLDALVSPTTPQTAFRFGEPVPESQADFTALANFAGCPAISVPMGADPAGMPIGLHLMAAPWCDSGLLEIARAFERATRT